MKRTATILALLLGTALPFAAAADDLKPLEAGTFILGTHTASVYYTVDGASYEVVTTIAPTDDVSGAGAPARFAASLLPDQKQTVAVGAFATGVAPAVLEMVRTGDTLSARILPARREVASR
jgi:hypothetical protein